jgi:hypothetical protein
VILEALRERWIARGVGDELEQQEPPFAALFEAECDFAGLFAQRAIAAAGSAAGAERLSCVLEALVEACVEQGKEQLFLVLEVVVDRAV